MGLIAASIRLLTNARALDVAVVDGAGDHVTGFDSSRPSTAALTSVASSVTSVSLLASNPARRRVVIHNDGSKTLFVAFAATASSTAFTVVVPSNQTYNGPLNDYTGDISGIWSSANGFARITEITT